MARSLTALKVLNFLTAKAATILVACTLVISYSISGLANTASVQSFTYEGRLYDTSGNPLAESVAFRIQILNLASDCVLYEERQTFNLSSSKGRFALEVGSDVGAGKRTGDDPGFAMWQVFKNTGSLAVPAAGCPGTPFNPALGEKRKLRVFVDPASGPEEKLSPDQNITSAPSSLMSQSLQGIGADGFVQITGNITQSNLDDLASEHTDLMDLAAGTSSLYMAAGSAVSTDDVFASDQMAIGTVTPAAGVELEIQNNDPTLRLEATDGGAGNMAIQFFDTAGTDQAQIMSTEGTAGLTFTTSGSSALVLDASQNAQFQASMTVAGTIQGGVYDTAQETGTLLPALTTCGAGCAGTQWMNSDLSLLRYWDGAAVRSVGSFNGAEVAGRALISNGPGNAPTFQVLDDTTKLSLDGSDTMAGDLNMGSNEITNLGSPVNAGDAVNKSYADANLVGETLAAPTAGEDLQAIRWNNTAGNWEYFSPTAGTVSAVSATAPLASSGGATPDISLNFNNGLTNNAGNLEVNLSSDLTFSTGQVAIATDGVTSTHILDGTISNVDIDTSADIARTKLADGTANMVLINDGTGAMSESATIDATELGQLNNVSSNIQTQLDSKQASLGFTPVDKAGDTMTGALGVNAAVTITGSADAVQLSAQAQAAQTANLFELKNSAGTAIFTVQADGTISAATDIADKDYVDTAIAGLTDNDTTYTADGEGIELSGTTFNIELDGTTLSKSATGLKVEEGNLDITAIGGYDANDNIDHTSVTLTAGDGLTGTGDISASRTFNVVGGDGIIANADDIAVDLDTDPGLEFNTGALRVKTGAGLSRDSTGIFHTDTSSVADSDNSNGVILQDITFDTFGHVQTVGTTDLDSRYYTETESDSTFVDASGDSMSGNLTMSTQSEIRLSDDDNSDYISLKAPTGTTQYDLTLPDGVGNANDVLQTDASGNLSWVAIPSAPVTDVFGRTGNVAAQSGDYNAGLITSSVTGDIAATNVQAAITELDTEKVPTTRSLSTPAAGGLSGGGNLSSDRSLSIDITGMTATSTQDAGDEIMIFSGNDTAMRKMSRADFIAGIDTDTNTTYSADGDGIEVASEVFSLELDGSTLQKGASGLSVNQANLDHGSIGGLTDDDHTQYAHLTGRSGGQSFIGGTDASDNLTIESTSDATKGFLILQPNGGNVGIGESSPDTPLHVAGGIKIGTMAAGDCDAVGEAGRIRYNSGDLDYCDGSSWQTLGTAAGGEVNTAANVGTGTGLFRNKTGTTINLKSINAEAGGEISITNNANDITLDVVEGNLDITAIGGYDANDNIDHTSVTLTAGDGLTGTGDISASRTFNVVGGDGIVANADDIAVDLDTNPGLEFNTGALRVKTGAGLSRDSTGIFHTDTSSVADSDNSNGVILQDITFDTFGHVQTVGTTDLDSRYYTETESDSAFVDAAGDSMTGALAITGSADAVQLSAQANAAQTANLFELKDSGGTPIFTVQADGTISAATDIVDKDYVDTAISGITDNDTTYTADGEGIEVASEEFSIELDGTTLSKSVTGLKVNTIGSSEITNDSITNDDINSSAAIARTKLANGTADMVLINDGSGVMSESATIDATELGHLNGVSSNIQTQLNGKQASLGYTPVDVAGDTMAGALDMGAGAAQLSTTDSEGSPAFTFQDDTDTGIFSPAADEIAISTAGSEAFRIDSSGNVGIGTTNPANTLHVKSDAQAAVAILETPDGSANSFNELQFRSDGDTKWSVGHFGDLNGATSRRNDFYIYQYQDQSDVAVSQARLTIDDSGSVGIGTVTPDASALLDVSSSTKGFLPPRMTTAERDAVASPVAGLQIYNTTTNKVNVYDGSSWSEVGSGSGFGTGNSGFVGSLKIDGVTSCTWGTTSNTFASLNTPDADCNAATVEGAALIPTEGKIPAIRFASLPAGRYQVVFNTVLHASAAGLCYFRITDGVNSYGIVETQNGDSERANLLTGIFSFSSAQTNKTFYIEAADDGTGATCNVRANGTSLTAFNAWVTRIDGNGSAIELADNNGDTKVQVEKNADENIIRFDTAGTERMTIDAAGDVNMTGDLTANSFTGDGSALTNIGATAIADGSITLADTNFGSTNGINIPQLAADPSSPTAGQMYYNTTTNKMMIYNGSSFVEVGSGAGGSGSQVFFQCTNEQSDGDATGDIAACVEATTNSGTGTTNYRAISCHSGTKIFGNALDWSGTEWEARNPSNTLVSCQDGSTIIVNLNALSGGSVATADADNDTKIQVEKNADEDKIRFDTAGTERMVIDASGNVGIGTTSPNAKLTVEGVMTLDQQGSDPTGTAGYGSLYTKTDGSLYYRDGTGTVTDLLASGSGNSLDQAYDVGGTVTVDDTGGNLTFNMTETADFVVQDNGSTAFTVLDNGNVGIGMAAPAYSLHVRKDQNSLTAFNIQNFNGGGSAGTSSTISGDVAATTLFAYGSGNADNRDGQGLANAGELIFSNSSKGLIGTSTSAPLHFLTNDTISTTIDTSGNVGIGTVSPNAKLTVEGAMTLDQLGADPTGTAGYGSLYTKSDGKLYYRDGTGTVTDLLAAGGTGDFKADGSVAMSGDINLGTSGITNTNSGVFAPLTIQPGTPAAGDGNNLILVGGAGSGLHRIGGNVTITGGDTTATGADIPGSVLINGGSGTGTGNVVLQETSGNVGIGDNTPEEKLTVAGNVKGVQFVSSSDRNLKRDIATLEGGLSKIKQLRGVTYHWRMDEFPERNFTPEKQYGVIAQEIENVFPELVHGEEGNKSVHYTGLISPLIEATKELATMCEMSEEQNKKLENMVNENQRRIASMEEKLQTQENQIEDLRKENAELKEKLNKVMKHLGL